METSAIVMTYYMISLLQENVKLGWIVAVRADWVRLVSGDQNG